jgi:serine/threonine protein phosphatase PrpC
MVRSANPVEKATYPKKTKASKAPKASSPLTFARYSVAHAYHPERNEDFIIADARTGLTAVFDGVGSTAGAVASRIASEVIHREWKKLLRDASSCQHIDLNAALQTLINKANDSLRPGEQRDSRAVHAGQGTDTTVVLAVFCQSDKQENAQPTYEMTYAHVGDSRIYLLPKGERLRRLTEDDGYFSLLLQDNLINQEDALRIDQAMYASDLTDLEQEYFDRRNGITQALGDVEPLAIHLGQVSLHPGDRVLLCSDGIHDNLLDSEIEDFLMNAARTTAARVLVNAAIRRSQEEDENLIRPKADDMSALVVTYREE